MIEKQHATRYISEILNSNVSEQTAENCGELLTKISSDMGSIKQDVSDIKGDVNTLSTNFSRLSTRVENTEYKLNIQPSEALKPIQSGKVNFHTMMVSDPTTGKSTPVPMTVYAQQQQQRLQGGIQAQHT